MNYLCLDLLMVIKTITLCIYSIITTEILVKAYKNEVEPSEVNKDTAKILTLDKKLSKMYFILT